MHGVNLKNLKKKIQKLVCVTVILERQNGVAWKFDFLSKSCMGKRMSLTPLAITEHLVSR